MESVTNFKLPWRLLREKLAVVNENNEILYTKTLEMIESDDIVSHAMSCKKFTWHLINNLFTFFDDVPFQRIGANDNEKITDTLYTNRENLEAIFRLIDLDCNGLITMDEFKEACDQLTGKN